MTQFTQFTNTNVEVARTKIEEKLAELKALGLDIDLGRITYGPNSFRAQVTVTIAGGPSAEELEYKRHLESIDFPDAVGKEIVLSGQKYTFMGFLPRKRTKKALIKCERGEFRIEFDRIKSQLK